MRNLFDIFNMIYTTICKQHISSVYAKVELLFFRETSIWVVWASLTLLALITVVACCIIVISYHQGVSLKLNSGSFLSRMGLVSKYNL